jgi:putative oxidoreductase
MPFHSLRSKATPITLTLLRVTVGVVMAAHGWLKIAHYSQWLDNMANMGIPAPEMMLPLSIAGEFLGGLGLIVGLLTPLAALGAASTMAVAIVTVHLENGLMAKDGGFEFPLTLLMASLFLAARGAGPFSLDAVLARFRSKAAGPEAAPSSAAAA